MELPPLVSTRLSDGLSMNQLLTDENAQEVIENLNKNKPVSWNLILTRQFEHEQKGADEANY